MISKNILYNKEIINNNEENLNNNKNNIKIKNETEQTEQTDLTDEKNELNELNNLIKELEEESMDSINSDYFTENEKKKLNNSKYMSNLIYYIFASIGFYLMYKCFKKKYVMLIFEIVLNLFYPYIFIPIKLFLCRTELTNMSFSL